MQSEASREWCLGLPLSEERSLAEEERNALKALLRRQKRRIAFVWGGFLAIAALLTFATIVFGPSFAIQPFVIIRSGLLAIALVSSALASRNALRRAFKLSKDLKSGTLHTYAGSFVADPAFQECYTEMVKMGMRPHNAGEPWRIDVLPKSRMLWAVDGQRAPGWLVAPAVLLADTPQFASMAAEWLEPIGKNDKGDVLGGQREISPAESAELRRVARVCWRRPVPYVLFMVFWIAVVTWGLSGPRAPAWSDDVVRYVYIIVLVALIIYMLGAGILRAKKLMTDIKIGRVIIVRYLRDEDSEMRPDLPISLDGMRTVEILPSSRWMWTEDGHPARWRKHSV